MEAFFGSWKLVESVNFDEFMEAIEVGPALRWYANKINPVVTFSQDGDDIVMATTMCEATNRGVTLSFKLGEEFDEHSLDFRFCKTVMNLEGGKLIQVQKWDGKETVAVREINDDKMVLTVTFQDVVCVRTYEKI